MSISLTAAQPPRYVMPGLPVGLAPAGRVASEVPLAFPNKFVTETLDYTVDFTYEAGTAAPAGGSLAGFTVTGLPVGVAGLTFSQMSVSGLMALFYIAGGVSGTQYMVTVTATLPNGKVMVAVIALQVLANPVPNNQPCTPPSPCDIQSTDGQVITDCSGHPITSA